MERFGRAVDSAIGVISPKAQAKRRAWRNHNSSFSDRDFNNSSSGSNNPKHRGAEHNRMRENWVPGGGSPDEDILHDLPLLRERSRDMVRNDATAAGISQTMITNVIGTGIMPKAQLDTDLLPIDDDQAAEFKAAAWRGFKRWARHADSRNRNPFWLIQQQLEAQILENGEVFVIVLRGLNDRWRSSGIALEVVEADRVATPSDKKADKSIRDGVKLGERGEPIGYYVRKTHPGDLTLAKTGAHGTDSKQFQFIPARDEFSGQQNIFHLYWQRRPAATRGTPFFTPVLDRLKDQADYLEAEVVAARVAACIALLITSPDPDGIQEANATEGQRDHLNRWIENLEPGMVDYLAPGETVSSFNPNRPGNTFEPFVERILRTIATGLNLPYELVAKDFSKTNYSSMRAALLEARAFFKERQKFFAELFVQPVYEIVLEDIYLRGGLPDFVDTIGFFSHQEDWSEAIFRGKGWRWVDPKKEVEASVLAVENGLSTMTDELANQGKDLEETLLTIQREKKMKERLGIEEKPPEPQENEFSRMIGNIVDKAVQSAMEAKFDEIEQEELVNA